MLRKHSKEAGDENALPPREMIEHLVHRIVVRPTKIVIELQKTASHGSHSPLQIPWSRPATSGSSELIVPAEPRDGGAVLDQAKPELMQAVVRAHLWLKQLQDGTYGSIEELGRVAKIHSKNVRLGLRLAFLAPKITKSVILGTQQDKKTFKRLNEIAEDPMWRTRMFIT